jgi:hypothetical protein
MFMVELGVVAVGLGLLAYFTWRPRGRRSGEPYARGTVGGGLVIIGVGVGLILAGLVSVIIN